MGMQSEIHRKLAGNRNSWECSLRFTGRVNRNSWECSLRFIDREIGTHGNAV